MQVALSHAATAPARTAVVIDDSVTMRNYLKLVLGQSGVKVVAESASGDDALALYETHRPALLTMDIVLPGTDGVSAARALLAAHPDACVVMCSSLTARDKVLACREAGVRHFIIKPFTAEKIQVVVKGIFGEAVAGAPK